MQTLYNTINKKTDKLYRLELLFHTWFLQQIAKLKLIKKSSRSIKALLKIPSFFL